MLVYVIALEEELNFELKVSQPEAKSDLEARVEALEKEVYNASKSEKKGINTRKVGPLRFELRTSAV